MDSILSLFKCVTAFFPALAKAFHETLDEFDNEFGVLEEPVLKAKDAQRLTEVEAEVNEQNERLALGQATFGAKLYQFSDWSREEIQGQKMGLNRSMGMVYPPESERNTPENQAKLDQVYSRFGLNRARLPKTYSSHAMGTF